MVATGDKAAGADVILRMAERAGADILQLDGSHVIMISQPRPVTDVILKALAAVVVAVGRRDARRASGGDRPAGSSPASHSSSAGT